jgi:hypothetical protein
MNETSTCQQGSTCKRQAMEEITNGPKQWWAPRAPQPSIAQVQEQYSPRYQTHQHGLVTEDSSGADGKENSTQRMYLRSRKN